MYNALDDHFVSSISEVTLLAKSLEIVDMDEFFASSSFPPVIVNNFNVESEIDKERLNRLIYTRYEGDALEVLPSCECGETRAGFLVNTKCPNCKTLVLPITERPLEPTLWICPPKGVTAFINPQVWAILSKAITHSGVNCLEYLVNPSYECSPTASKAVRKFLSLEIPRGINYFHDHFDEIMETLFDNGIVKGEDGDHGGKRDDLVKFIAMYRKSIFCHSLPIPSKMMFITEKTLTSTFADRTMEPAIDAIRTISATENSSTPLTLKKLQSRAMKANRLLVDYHQDFVTNFLASKPGWWRKHVFGGRSPFTFRAVINSLSENHRYDELHLPWSLSVMVFSIHLTSKLFRRGFSPNAAAAFLNEHTLKYHPLLDELFQELITEAPEEGIAVIFGRNPTLMRGSIQRLYVTRVKTDPTINSISLSVLVLKSYN